MIAALKVLANQSTYECLADFGKYIEIADLDHIVVIYNISIKVRVT